MTAKMKMTIKWEVRWDKPYYAEILAHGYLDGKPAALNFYGQTYGPEASVKASLDQAINRIRSIYVADWYNTNVTEEIIQVPRS